MDAVCMCNWPGCKPVRAVSTERLLSTGKSFDVCRRHRTLLNKWNAQAIGECEWSRTSLGMRAPRCNLTPVTMALEDSLSEKVAVCRKHNSVINAHNARSRVRED